MSPSLLPREITIKSSKASPQFIGSFDRTTPSSDGSFLGKKFPSCMRLPGRSRHRKSMSDLVHHQDWDGVVAYKGSDRWQDSGLSDRSEGLKSIDQSTGGSVKISLLSRAVALHAPLDAIVALTAVDDNEDLESKTNHRERSMSTASSSSYSSTLFPHAMVDSPLHIASRNGSSPAVVEALVQFHPEWAILLDDTNGYVPLHHAIEYYSKRVNPKNTFHTLDDGIFFLCEEDRRDDSMTKEEAMLQVISALAHASPGSISMSGGQFNETPLEMAVRLECPASAKLFALCTEDEPTTMRAPSA
eukprot:scaffold16719_cov52-Attheya_sp.AAC.1